MTFAVFNTIDSAVINGIKGVGAQYNSANKNYTVGGTTYDLERYVSGSTLVLRQQVAGQANPKVALTQNVFDTIRNGSVASPTPTAPGAHPVFVFGAVRREIVQTGKTNAWSSEVGVSFYDIAQNIRDDIKTGGAVYDGSIQGYKIGTTQYTVKRLSATTNYDLVRQTGVATTGRVYLTQEMFDIIKNYTYVAAIPPDPCFHPTFDQNGLKVSIAFLFASAAPFQGLAIRHNGP